MNHILSYETALRLKKAGFPQNEMAPGQMWWMGKHGVSVAPSVATLSTEGDIRLIPLHDLADGLIIEDLVCAPDAPSILQEFRSESISVWLAPGMALTREKPHTDIRLFRAEARVVNTTGLGFDPYRTKIFQFEHENAAEAVAALWLAIHETGGHSGRKTNLSAPTPVGSFRISSISGSWGDSGFDRCVKKCQLCEAVDLRQSPCSNRRKHVELSLASVSAVDGDFIYRAFLDGKTVHLTISD